VNYDEAGIPAKATKLDWTDLDSDPAIDRVHTWADGYPNRVLSNYGAETQDIGLGLLLHGDVSRGKTTAAALALKRVIDYGHAGWFVPMGTLEDLLHRQMDLNTYMRKVDTVDAETQDSFEQITRRLTKIRFRYYVVVLDDWGRERMASSFLQDYVEALMRERYNRGLPTIITTNRSPADIEGAISRQFSSFLGEACTFIEFSGENHRHGPR
jgi:DNA replication protein DnaC